MEQPLEARDVVGLEQPVEFGLVLVDMRRVGVQPPQRRLLIGSS